MSLSLQICVNFSEHDKDLESDSSTPRLNLVVSLVNATVKQTTWNLQVTASMNSVTIRDYYASGRGVTEGLEPQLLLAAIAEDDREAGKFLSVEYIKVHIHCHSCCLVRLKTHKQRRGHASHVSGKIFLVLNRRLWGYSKMVIG